METDKKSTYQGYTAAKAKANAKWEKSQSRILLRLKPEIKEIVDNHAGEMNESTAHFITRAILAQIERDNAEK